MKIKFTLFTTLFAALLFCSLFNANAAQTTRNSIDKFTINSKVLDEQRTMYVSKPLGYADSDERYFVVYVLDGETSIDYTKAIAELLYQSGFPKMLIVGIENTHRNRDLTPTQWREAADGGGADNFLRFIKEELMPSINKNYRAHDYNVLIGHSLGGLMASHIMCKDTNLFDAMVALSPSVFYDDFYALKRIESLFERIPENMPKEFPDFYFAMGDEPGEEGDGIIKMNEYFKKNAPKNLNWKFDFYAKESHTSVPLVGTLDGIRFVFRDFVLDNSFALSYLEPIKAHFVRLSDKFGKNVKVPQRILMNLGWTQWDRGEQQAAIDTFKYYAKIYPNMVIPYDSLSEYYDRQGKTQMAIDELVKLLKIVPGFGHAQEKLKVLRAKLKA